MLLRFSTWASELTAHDLNGRQLWTYPAGIDDVWASDLTGDTLDEIIVGYNDRDGLHVLNSEGRLIWKSNRIANVWHVCAGNVWGEETPQVLTTASGGTIHVFSADGSRWASLSDRRESDDIGRG